MAKRARRTAVRYAVVGLGHIAQVAVLPAFAHARAQLGAGGACQRRPDEAASAVEEIPGPELTRTSSTRTVWSRSMRCTSRCRTRCTPSTRSAPPDAGVHVLCEKPMAVTADECEQMIEACREHGVKLMVAYRLHFEEINLNAIDIVRRGRIGDPKFFNSSFSMTVRPGDIRTKRALGGGTLYDIGVYCINAARGLFRAEPKEVWRCRSTAGRPAAARSTSPRPPCCDSTANVSPPSSTSFNADDVASYRIVGTKGQLHVNPAYQYAEGLAYELTINGKTTAPPDRQARSVRAGAAVLLRLHPQEPRPGTVRRAGTAGRPHRAGAV